MKLLVYAPGKEASYGQRTLPRRLEAAWSRIQMFLATWVASDLPDQVLVDSFAEPAEEDRIAEWYAKMSDSMGLPIEKDKTVESLTKRQLARGIELLLATAESSDFQAFPGLAVSPVEIRLNYIFRWNLKNNNLPAFTFPEWYRDYDGRSTTQIALGKYTYIYPYFVFPYDFGSKEQKILVSSVVEDLPISWAERHFRIYEKARTSDDYRVRKLTTEQRSKLAAMIQ